MINTESLLVPGLLGGGLLIGFWNYIKDFLLRITSFFWVTANTTWTHEGQLEKAITYYFNSNFKESFFNEKTYYGRELFLRITNKKQLIGLEDVGNNYKIYWKGWKPIVLHKDDNGGQLNFSYFRGTFNSESLILSAIDTFNNVKQKNDNRYCVNFICGKQKNFGQNQQSNKSEKKGSQPSFLGSEEDRGDWYRFLKILRYKQEDIGPSRTEKETYITTSPEITEAIKEATFWKNSEDWYSEKKISWKRGWLLYGPAGTGKTSLARMIAETLDLPVFVFDLGSLSNEELRKEWSKMLENVPCMALIEDIDSVFDKRKNVTGREEKALSFDCLLNCIDGIERSNGLFTVITTNKLNKIDPALAKINTGDRMSSRPGRIDRILQIKHPKRESLQIMCKRMLPNCKDLWKNTVDIGEKNKETMSQFQERCARIALEKHWESLKIEKELQEPRIPPPKKS